MCAEYSNKNIYNNWANKIFNFFVKLDCKTVMRSSLVVDFDTSMEIVTLSDFDVYFDVDREVFGLAPG